VWTSLHACGLEAYYTLRAAEHAVGNRPIERTLAWLDHDAFQTRHVRALDGGRCAVELRLDGMRCGACLWLLESLPRLERGVLRSRVDLGRSVIELEWETGKVRLSTIAERLARLGYDTWPIGSTASRDAWRAQDRRWLIDLGVAAAISGNVMAIAFALYGADVSWMDAPTRQFLQWTSVGLAALSIAWPGRIYLRNAVAAIRSRTPHVDVPIALALLAGLGGGLGMTIAGRAGVYLESVTMLVVLLLAGRFVQFRQQRRARHELELLCALVPQAAQRMTSDGSVEEVPADALQPGDLVRVADGDASPADGTLVQSTGHVDLQWLTGESRPVSLSEGDDVPAGARAVGGPLMVRVVCSGDDTRAAGMTRLVESAMRSRAPVVEFADRIAGWFLACVIILTAITGVVWWHIDADRAPGIVVAMLVVTCPCALGLATPLTMVASLGKAARAGILVRAGDVFERLARSGTIILDKTGTVTEGRMAVLDSFGDDEAIRLAATLERHGRHPVARAIAQLPHNAPGGVSEVREHAGRGIEGRVDGRSVSVTSVRAAAGLAPELARAAARFAESCLTPVVITVDGRPRAVVGIGDPLRTDAAGLVTSMRSRGWTVLMASGDVVPVVASVAGSLGIDVRDAHAACTPEAKLSVVRRTHAHPVVMVGDGLNDLPAMAAADVSIAVRQGARSTVDAADVSLAGGGVASIVALMDGARRTMRTIHVNFAVSLAYNVVGAVLAATGTISPWIAAIMMPLSGLTVTAIALRMPRFDAPLGPAERAPTETGAESWRC
jgi:Cu2+-exporting ATPase